MISSPCVDICRMDPKLQRCVGCWRTIEHLENWVRYTEQQRLEIMEELEIAQWETGHKTF